MSDENEVQAASELTTGGYWSHERIETTAVNHRDLHDGDIDWTMPDLDDALDQLEGDQ
jgi:hypothetical protein